MCFFKIKKDKCDIEKEIEGLLNIAINKYLSISHSIVCEEGFEPINVHSVNIVDYSFNLVDSGTKYFSFMHALSDYRDMLMKEGMVSFIITNLEKSKLRIEGRVKNFNSISSKIEYYVYMKDERGEIPIYKCLNDLYGLRAIIDDSMQLSDLYDCISKICFSIMPSEKNITQSMCTYERTIIHCLGRSSSGSKKMIGRIVFLIKNISRPIPHGKETSMKERLLIQEFQNDFTHYLFV